MPLTVLTCRPCGGGCEGEGGADDGLGLAVEGLVAHLQHRGAASGALSGKYVRRRSIKGKRPAVKAVKLILHYNLLVWRQSRHFFRKIAGGHGVKVLSSDTYAVRNVRKTNGANGHGKGATKTVAKK